MNCLTCDRHFSDPAFKKLEAQDGSMVPTYWWKADRAPNTTGFTLVFCDAKCSTEWYLGARK